MPLPPASSTPRRRLSPSGLNASVQKVWMVCGIGPHGPIHCRAKPPTGNVSGPRQNNIAAGIVSREDQQGGSG